MKVALLLISFHGRLELFNRKKMVALLGGDLATSVVWTKTQIESLRFYIACINLTSNKSNVLTQTVFVEEGAKTSSKFFCHLKNRQKQ